MFFLFLFTSHKTIRNLVLASCLAGAYLAGGVSVAHAATLYLNPSAQSVSVGGTVTVNVLVNTDGKYANSSDAIIRFPNDLLEVVSVNKTRSIFSLWIEEPKFSNYDGTVTFNGGVPSPGFLGGGGGLVSIVFKGKKAGSATISFSDSSVRENDGLGTDILSAKIPTTITVGASSEDPVKVIAPPKSLTPDRPVIFSSTHPQQDVWYKNREAVFSWTVPSTVNSEQASLNKTELVVPTVSYDGSVSSKTLNNLEDGVYHFNLRQQNEAGWSPTAHYQIRVDATDPAEFSLNAREKDNRNVITLAAIDETSGIDHYTVKVDSQAEVLVDAHTLPKGGAYVLPPQSRGDHTVTVTAYDKAGNKRERKDSFVSPEVTPPHISLSAESIENGGSLVVSGTTIYPHTNIEVVLQAGSGKPQLYPQTTDSDGAFTVAIDNLKKNGSIGVWAQIVLGDNTKSQPSAKLYVTVADSKIRQTMNGFFIPILEIVLIVLLTMAFVYALYLGWHKFFGLRNKLRHDLQDTAAGIHKVMVAMKEELEDQLKVLQKAKEDRKLNEKEQKIFKDLEKNVDDIDKFIQKKIKKVL